VPSRILIHETSPYGSSVASFFPSLDSKDTYWRYARASAVTSSATLEGISVGMLQGCRYLFCKKGVSANWLRRSPVAHSSPAIIAYIQWRHQKARRNKAIYCCRVNRIVGVISQERKKREFSAFAHPRNKPPKISTNGAKLGRQETPQARCEWRMGLQFPSHDAAAAQMHHQTQQMSEMHHQVQ
jgi:hypothetical protein